MADQRRTRIRMSDLEPLPRSVIIYEDGTRGDEPPKRRWWQLLHRPRDRSQRSSSRASGTVTQR